jgi:hypothetical protein
VTFESIQQNPGISTLARLAPAISDPHPHCWKPNPSDILIDETDTLIARPNSQSLRARHWRERAAEGDGIARRAS